MRAASERKWLEIHGREHWTEFYTDYGVALQKRFFGHFLKGEDNGWDRQRRVMLRVRTVDGGFIDRAEDEWPIARTRWAALHLDATTATLTSHPVLEEGSESFDALESDGVTFSTPPFETETEITGPVSAKLFVSSSTTDADLFLVLRVFTPDGEEIVFQGAIDSHTPVGHGWLRVSHRKLDRALTTEFRPYHTHDEPQSLEPGKVYEVDVEIWPTSIVVPVGYRVALTIRGKDYEYAGADAAGGLSHFKGSRFTGVGIYTHRDPTSRPRDIYGGTTTVHTGGPHGSFLLLPVVPADRA